MKNSWTNFIVGFTKIKVVGKYTELFLNTCIRENISIWKIKRVGEETIVCYLALKDVSNIRQLVKQTKVKVYFLEKKGFPFFIKKMISRSGLVIGLVSFIAILFILSNMVWKVSIEGASPKVEHQLEQVVNDLGIKRGKLQFLVPEVENIQMIVTEAIEEATWIGVTLSGTTYHFQVVEKAFPEKKEPISPRHLIAKKKAIIDDIFVENGQGVVSPNDFVEEGELLISGFIGKEGKMEIAPAKGKVFGEIWYKSSVTVPLVSEIATLTGEKKIKHSLSIFNLNAPIWGFGKAKFSKYEINESNRSFQFLKWQLPLQYTVKTLLEKQSLTREYTKEEASKIAVEMAKQQLMKKLADDAVIKSEKILQETIENGKVKLMIHYQVIEDIAKIQPIIQGD